MKNDRTPRTLSDCTFEVGYPTERQATPTNWREIWFMAAVAVLGMLGWFVSIGG